MIALGASPSHLEEINREYAVLDAAPLGAPAPEPMRCTPSAIAACGLRSPTTSRFPPGRRESHGRPAARSFLRTCASPARGFVQGCRHGRVRTNGRGAALWPAAVEEPITGIKREIDAIENCGEPLDVRLTAVPSELAAAAAFCKAHDLALTESHRPSRTRRCGARSSASSLCWRRSRPPKTPRRG